MYYYNARYYDPKLARFITADTIVPDPLNPQDLNRYSYCANNPVNFIDPSGHGWKKFWKKVVAVVEIVVGAVLTYYGCPAGPVMMAHGFATLGANSSGGGGVSVNGNGDTSRFSFNPETGERYDFQDPSGQGKNGGSEYSTNDRLDPKYYNRMDSNTERDISLNMTVNFDDYLNNPDYMVADAGGRMVVNYPENIPSWLKPDGTEFLIGGPAMAGEKITGKGLVRLLHNKDISIGAAKLNIKLTGPKGINIITKSGSRFEVGYHEFGLGPKRFHINLNGKHYYPRIGWPPYGMK